MFTQLDIVTVIGRVVFAANVSLIYYYHWCWVPAQQTKAEDEAADPAVVAELQREVEDLKLRLHMAAEHYKDKYKECQRLQKQVQRLSEQQGVGDTCWADAYPARLQERPHLGLVPAHSGVQSRWKMESFAVTVSHAVEESLVTVTKRLSV